MSDREKLIGTKRAARLFDCDAVTIRRMVKEGRLPYYRVGRLVKFDENEILASIKHEPKAEK